MIYTYMHNIDPNPPNISQNSKILGPKNVHCNFYSLLSHPLPNKKSYLDMDILGLPM
jgi:hypothetical protein